MRLIKGNYGEAGWRFTDRCGFFFDVSVSLFTNTCTNLNLTRKKTPHIYFIYIIFRLFLKLLVGGLIYSRNRLKRFKAN